MKKIIILLIAMSYLHWNTYADLFIPWSNCKDFDDRCYYNCLKNSDKIYADPDCETNCCKSDKNYKYAETETNTWNELEQKENLQFNEAEIQNENNIQNISTGTKDQEVLSIDKQKTTNTWTIDIQNDWKNNNIKNTYNYRNYSKTLPIIFLILIFWLLIFKIEKNRKNKLNTNKKNLW